MLPFKVHFHIMFCISALMVVSTENPNLQFVQDLPLSV